MSESKSRTAVVIIHGIGEQRPMSTMRSFVSSLLNFERRGEAVTKENREWIKPDRISNSYELRKISAKKEKGRRGTTHFYEYHWAANMRDSTSSHVFKWLWSLMIRKFEKTDWRINFLKSICSLLFFFWFFLAFTPLVVFILFSSYSIISNFIIKWAIWTFLPLIILKYFIPKIFIGFIGDAARYLSNDVDNISERESIRKDGVTFLKNLHESGEYDRIIIVGHSLGSVIAYDLITYLWIDFNKSISLNKSQELKKNTKWHDQLSHSDQQNQSLSSLSTAARNLWKLYTESKGNKRSEEIIKTKEFKAFQSCQKDFWMNVAKNTRGKDNADSSSEQDSTGWLISDLITLGSPLTHGDLLMAESLSQFENMKSERQFPTCPPSEDPPPPGKEQENEIEDKDFFVYKNEGGELFLNHGTPFFPTKWTNIFFKGDLIGGPLGDKFGPGIDDVVVEHNCSGWRKWLLDRSPKAHNNYWTAVSTPQNIEQKKEFKAIEQIYLAMDFERLL